MRDPSRATPVFPAWALRQSSQYPSLLSNHPADHEQIPAIKSAQACTVVDAAVSGFIQTLSTPIVETHVFANSDPRTAEESLKCEYGAKSCVQAHAGAAMIN